MMRLVDLAVIDSENHVYRLPGRRLEHVFDSDVALETSCYQIDTIDMRLKLKRPPAGTVRALVWMDEDGHRKNFVPDMGNIIGLAGQEFAMSPRKVEYEASIGWVEDLPLENISRPSSDEETRKLFATGFKSVIGELQEIRRELAVAHRTDCDIAHELKRANSR